MDFGFRNVAISLKISWISIILQKEIRGPSSVLFFMIYVRSCSRLNSMLLLKMFF